MGITKSELLNHYYIDELPEIMIEYNKMMERRYKDTDKEESDELDPNKMTAEDMTRLFM